MLRSDWFQWYQCSGMISEIAYYAMRLVNPFAYYMDHEDADDEGKSH